MREREKKALWEEMVYQCGASFSDAELVKYHKRFLRSWEDSRSVIMLKKEDLRTLVTVPSSERQKPKTALTGMKRRFSLHHEHSDDSEESLPLAVWKKRANNNEQKPRQSFVAHVPKAKRSRGPPSISAKLPEPENWEEMSEASKTIAKYNDCQEKFRASLPVDEAFERDRKANLEALLAEKRKELKSEMKAQRLAASQRKPRNSGVKIHEVQAAHIAPGVINLSPAKELPKKDTRKMPGGKKIAERNGPFIQLNGSVQRKLCAPLMLNSIRIDHTYNMPPATGDMNFQKKEEKFDVTTRPTNDIEVEELLIDDALEMTTPVTDVNLDLCEILQNNLVSEIEMFNCTNGANDHLDMQVDNGIELWLRDMEAEMPDKLDYELNEKQVENITDCIDIINSSTEDMPLVFDSSGNNDTLCEFEHYDQQLKVKSEPQKIETILFDNRALLELTEASDINKHNKEFMLEDQRSKDTTVNKTPLEMEAAENIELSYDDDDVLSVAASCYDLEDLINDEPAMKSVHQQQGERKKEIDLQKLKEQPKVVGDRKNEIDFQKLEEQQNVVEERKIEIDLQKLKEQPKVMQSLYKASEVKPKPKSEPVAVARNPQPLANSEPVAVSRNPQDDINIQRAQALAARRSSTNCPVFAPPYRLPQVSDSNESNNIECVSTDNYNGNILKILGIKCWPNLDLDCSKLDCHHESQSVPDVVRRLTRLDESELISSYEFLRESSILFKQYITHFADIFANRRLFRCLIQTVVDCRLYKEFCAPYLVHLYTAFKHFGKEEEGLSCIMQHLWMPSKATKFQDLTEAILNILSSANWYDYMTELTDLFKNHCFPMPNEFMTVIVKSAIIKREINREMLQLALQLVLLRRVDGVHDKALVDTLNMIACSDATTKLESTSIETTSETLQQPPLSNECQNSSSKDQCASKNRARILSVDYLHTAENGVSTWHPYDNYNPN
ncbi:uncharacterized protein del isoform X2 [Drosophila tropicalis]|uniref:uncharacterized protein del isoform X2 n=1 Tax=Drosophila tropicalis TaxID=46794 RepID=UPI0035AC1B5A